MTKRLAGLALVGAAAVTFALPATPASAACNWTFPEECIAQLVATPDPVCIWIGTFPYCV